MFTSRTLPLLSQKIEVRPVGTLRVGMFPRFPFSEYDPADEGVKFFLSELADVGFQFVDAHVVSLFAG